MLNMARLVNIIDSNAGSQSERSSQVPERGMGSHPPVMYPASFLRICIDNLTSAYSAGRDNQILETLMCKLSNKI